MVKTQKEHDKNEIYLNGPCVSLSVFSLAISSLW